jgi:tetratricopeptide (TPR) repeat protein
VTNDLSGHVTGPVVQARDIDTVHFHLPPPPTPPRPAQLPRQRTRVFVDRDDATTWLTRTHTANRTDLVVVSGPAGIGKTTLVLRWAATQPDAFPDGQLHVDFAVEPDLTGEMVLRRWLRALGVAADAVPPHPMEAAALWRSLTHHQRLLLVLDGVRTADHVLPVLPASPHALTVVASRHPLPDLITAGARQWDLGGLPSWAAVELLTAFAGADRAAREPTHLLDLARDCGGDPSAAVLLGGHLAAHPRLSIAELAARHRLATTTPRDAAMDMAHADITPADRELLDLLRAVGGPGLTAATISALDPRGLTGQQEALAGLIERGLLQQITDHSQVTRYRALDSRGLPSADHDAPISTVHTEPASGSGSPHRSLLITRLVDHYVRQVSAVAETLEPGKHAYSVLRRDASRFTDRATARAWFDRERVTAQRVLRLAATLGMTEQAWQLGEALWVPLRFAGHREDVLSSQQLAADTARRLGHVYESAALARCGWALTWLGRPAGARGYAERATRIAEQHADDWALATALSTLGRALTADRAFRDALEVFRRCIALDMRTGASPWVVGMRHRHKAAALRGLGHLDDAVEAGQLAVWLITLDTTRTAEAARAMTEPALTLIELARVEEAHTQLVGAVELLDPNTDHMHVGEVHALLLRTATALGHGDAEQHRRLAVAAFDRAGHPQHAATLREGQ